VLTAYTPAYEALLVPTAAEAAAGAEGWLGASMAEVDAMHAACGLPWWASIGALAVGVRAAMLPVSLQGLKASAALMPLLRQARQPPAADGPGAQPRSLRDAAARFRALRAAAGAPYPGWILASPLLQLPVFVAAMASIRTMSLTGWPGFAAGGAAWFPDLTQPALDLATMTAPMGEPSPPPPPPRNLAAVCWSQLRTWRGSGWMVGHGSPTIHFFLKLPTAPPVVPQAPLAWCCP
jgi:YidC/Oxa1 family membrane protein insertase